MAFTPELPGNSSLPILASAVPTSTKAVVTVIAVGIAAALIYYTSPARLTRVLVDAMTVAEKTYLEAFETGLLAASDVFTIGTSLSRLQLKVSEIRQETLHDSRSNWKELCGFLKATVSPFTVASGRFAISRLTLRLVCHFTLAHFPCLARSPTKMLAVRETPFSVVASAFANNLTIKALAVITVFVVIPLTAHYASPARLTDILDDIMSRVNALCAEALEAGYLSASEMERLRKCAEFACPSVVYS
ncbi:hypothetical protein DFH06DRAFT_1447129 [Mycena polygramma]|nr:hypothetical protein DFH06DRAFT_1447129 [Mycena polygramma]